MQEYTKRKQEHAGREAGRLSQTEKAGSIPNSSMEAIMAGRARASSKMMGHRQDLAPSLNAKMAKAFGMDLSNMQIYRSEAMSGTETQGLASGNKIVLSKDVDLNTMAGQAILGHEISHVHAQSQGIGMGHSGLYQNAGLEHQADVEGMMAARGQSILGDGTGMDMGLGMGGIGGLTPMGAGMSASAGAPMQAKGKGRKKVTFSNLRAVQEEYEKKNKYRDMDKKARQLANAMENDSSRDKTQAFDEEMFNRMTSKGVDTGAYYATVKKEPHFKKMVQADMQRRFLSNKYLDNNQVDKHRDIEEWYGETLMPSLENEFMTGKESSIPIDYEEYLKSAAGKRKRKKRK